MKIRLGFVSNSSSSSFCVYGLSLRSIDFINYSKRKNPMTEHEYEELDMDQTAQLVDKIIEKHIKKYKLNNELRYELDDEYVYVGRPYETLGENETGHAFKELAKKILEQLLPNADEINPRHICEIVCSG